MSFLEDKKIVLILNIFIIVLCLIIIGGLFYFNLSDNNKNISYVNDDTVAINDSNDINSASETGIVEDTSKEKVLYKVDIKGAVKKPGVYELEENSIVNDVIKAAGGLKNNASTKYVNLSKKISDEMVIYIYTVNQVKNLNVTSTETCKSSTIDISNCEGSSIIESNGNSNSSSSSSNNSTNSGTTSNSKISINNGTKEELMTLSGIGEAKALAIIKYREENNGFQKLEDIMNVSGIGEAAYNKIKDYITL